MDLIDRQAAIDALISESRIVDGHYTEYERIIHESDAIEAISMLPSAETKWIPTSERLPEEDGDYIVIEATYMLPSAERKGRWFDYVDWCKCSVCKTTQSAKTKYCPNCGAKMEADE